MLKPTRLAPEHYHHDGYWEDRTLSSFLDESVDAQRTSVALLEADHSFTFDEIRSMAQNIAAGLDRLGVQQHDVVTVELPNWWEAAVTFHGLAWAGCVTNPVVPIYRESELAFILKQAQTKAIVIPHTFRGFDYVQMVITMLPDLDTKPVVIVVRPEGPLPEGFVSFDALLEPAKPRAAVGDPNDVCLLLYTSGTTSDPKGVLHNHQTIVWEMRSIITLMELSCSDSTFMPSPVGHLTGIVYGVYLPTLLHQSTTLLDIWDPAEAMRLIERDACTFSLGATPFLRGLVAEYERLGKTSTLRTFLCGGADVPPNLIRVAREQLDAVVSRSYGSSEMPVYCTTGPTSSIDIAAESDGLAIPPGQGQLVDITDGVGELVVRGPELFLGYLDASLNEAAFTEDGYFRTGDLASIDDAGAISIRGRAKDIIIRGGENISALQIELHLLEHPEIADVAVVAMPDADLGERACAFIVTKNGNLPTTAELFTFLRGNGLAAQKVPERVVEVTDLPRTPSGKIQKFLLREKAKELADAGETA